MGKRWLVHRVGVGYRSWVFQDGPPLLPITHFIFPKQARHLAGPSTRDVDYTSNKLALTQFNRILPPLPHNCDNSEKVKRENKHVLTIWDVVQLTAISNIYCKILTPINRRGWSGSFAHKTRPFLCTAPWRGSSGLSFHHNQCQTEGLNRDFRPQKMQR